MSACVAVLGVLACDKLLGLDDLSVMVEGRGWRPLIGLWVLVALALGLASASVSFAGPRLRARALEHYAKAAAETPGNAQAVTLEFSSADVVSLEPRSLSRWLPLSGTLQPVNQTTVKAKVSGEIRQVLVREGETVKAGQVLARFDTSDLDAKLNDRVGALEASRAQLALAEKTRAQNLLLLKQKFISQTAFDSAESGESES